MSKLTDLKALANLVFFSGSSGFFFVNGEIDEATMEAFKGLPDSVRIVLIASNMITPYNIHRSDFHYGLDYLENDDERKSALALAVEAAVKQKRDIRYFVASAIEYSEYKGWEVPEVWCEIASAMKILDKHQPR